MDKKSIKEFLDYIYEKFNKKEYIEKDPVKYVHAFNNPEDKEIVGFIVSTLSLGRIDQIFKAMDKLLKVIGEKPSEFFREEKSFHGFLRGFSYRFFKDEDIEDLFRWISEVIKKYGRIKNLFFTYWNLEKNLKIAIHNFVSETRIRNSLLLPDPLNGSPCKRLNMFLRWMVRRDDVDTGLWSEIGTSSLIIPLDTHISQIGRTLGFTQRKCNDWKTAEEITEALKEYDPLDPIKYDFSLCRANIEKELEKFKFLKNEI